MPLIINMKSASCDCFMADIIPSINTRVFDEAKKRIAQVEPHVSWCHVDVTDGVFSRHITWNNPAELAKIETRLDIEVHLMVQEPEKIIDQWLIGPVKRIIVHIEAMKDPEVTITKCRTAGVEIGFSVSPETPWEKLLPWFGKVDVVQALAVSPGPSGQEVDWPSMLGKIDGIRKACPRCIIEIDGGVNPESIKKTASAGANLFVVGNYLFSSDNIERAIGELKKT